MRPARRALVGLLVAGIAAASSSGTLATGTLVLSDTVSSGTACLSSGTTATDNVSTDTNANAACAAAFTLATRSPGATATAAIAITNEGSLAAATGLRAYGAGPCTDGDTAEAYHGSASPCGTIQTYVQQTDASGTATSCLYGNGASGVLNSTVRTFPFGVGNGKTLSLTVDGVAHSNLPIAAGTYTQAGLAGALNNAFGAWATAAVGPDNRIYISSNTRGPTSSIDVDDAPNNFGLLNAPAGTGGQVSCSYDAVHTLTHFTSNHTGTANGLDLGALAPGATDYVVVGAQLPSAAGNDVQGRVATFGYTFTATQ